MGGITRQDVESYIKKAYDEGWFNGVWLLRKEGEVISRGSMGKAHPYQDRDLNEDTVFELASVSKHFTACAIMLLRDAGMLSLDDQLEKYIPDLPYKGIRIRNLLNHTSGLPDYMEWVTKAAAERKCIPGNDIIIDFLRRGGDKALFAPEEGWAYCNTAYCVLAYLVGLISKTPYAEFMTNNFFEPLGMTNTCVYHRRMNGETIENYAYGMVLSGGKYVLPDDTDLDESGFVIPLDGMEGDGIINTNLDDLVKWDIALRTGKALLPHTLAEMYNATRTADGELYPYGYGWRIQNDEQYGMYVAHGGGWPGYSTYYVRLLEEDGLLILLMNTTGCDDAARMSFRDGMESMLLGKAPPDVLPLEALVDRGFDVSRFKALCGEYSDGLCVFEENGALHISINLRGDEMTYALYPIGGDEFMTDKDALKVRLDGKTADYSSIGKTFIHQKI